MSSAAQNPLISRKEHPAEAWERSDSTPRRLKGYVVQFAGVIRENRDNINVSVAIIIGTRSTSKIAAKVEAKESSVNDTGLKAGD